MKSLKLNNVVTWRVRMSELKQLEKRIKDSGPEGITTAIIKDHYEPAGQLMITRLVDSGEFISRRDNAQVGVAGPWKVWAKGFEPY
jgi:hypothetical protein